MFTVYDFINSEIDPRRLKCGWKVEIVRRGGVFARTAIVLRYTCLSFDWKTLDEFINGELWNLFLSSKSYAGMKAKLDRAKEKYGRTYYEADSIDELKGLAEGAGLKINLDGLIDRAVRRKSEKIREEKAGAPGIESK